MTTFTQLNARLKIFLNGWLLVLGLKECLLECATSFVKSEVILELMKNSDTICFHLSVCQIVIHIFLKCRKTQPRVSEKFDGFRILNIINSNQNSNQNSDLFFLVSMFLEFTYVDVLLLQNTKIEISRKFTKCKVKAS